MRALEEREREREREPSFECAESFRSSGFASLPHYGGWRWEEKQIVDRRRHWEKARKREVDLGREIYLAESRGWNRRIRAWNNNGAKMTALRLNQSTTASRVKASRRSPFYFSDVALLLCSTTATISIR